MELSQIYFLSEIGGKKNQEDFIWPLPGSVTLQDKVFIVSDGVGGSENGEVASRIISEAVGNALVNKKEAELSAIEVDQFLSDARDVLVEFAREKGLSPDMATTFTLLVLSDTKAFIAWCGDSRVYHIRKGEILYKTSDHSLVNSLVKSGEITEEEANIHPKKNIILRAIKADESIIETDFHLIEEVKDGDYFMLCTDGLLENITDKDLRFLLTKNDEGNIDIVEAFQQFCRGKTRDNYSMYLMKVSTKQKVVENNKRKYSTFLFLTLVTIASVLIFNQFRNSKETSKEKIIPINPFDSVSKAITDTFEKIRNTQSKTVKLKAEQKNIANNVKPLDASSPKEGLPKKAKGLPNIIEIDNSEDFKQNSEAKENQPLFTLPKEHNKKTKILMPPKDSVPNDPTQLKKE